MNSSRGSVCLVFVASTSGLLLPLIANAGIFEERCNDDSLSSPQAVLRLEWARQCGTRINIVSPTNPDENRRFQAGMTDGNGVALWEYAETDGTNHRNSYTGKEYGGTYVNTTYKDRLYRAFPATIIAMPDSRGFQMWTKPAILAQPLYPTFANQAAIAGSAPLYPHPRYLNQDYSDCNLYTDRAGTNVANVALPNGFYVSGYCTASCYTPDQVIAFSDGDEKIIDAITAVRPKGLTTIAPGSTLERLQFRTDDVGSYTRELRDSTHVIYELRTASGGELRVTPTHPVIESSGRIVHASSLRVGDKLIKADGSVDPIVAVEKTSHFGKVYNIKPRSPERIENILVAQGYLVGSSRYQNEDVDYINRMIFSHGIPKAVIPQ